MSKANFFNLKRGHWSNALQIQIGIDRLRGGGEEEGWRDGGGDGQMIKVKEGVCCMRSYLLSKRTNTLSIVNHITEEQRGRRGTGCYEKHFSLLMQTNYSPQPKDSHYLRGKRQHVC